MKVAATVSDLIGDTPLLDLAPILAQHGVTGDDAPKLYGKLESLGPCSSVKDRIARSMLDRAEADGLIRRGYTTLVEPTSGNTGIALAFLARERGYDCILIMPDSVTVERSMMILGLGAKVVLAPREGGFPGMLDMAQDLLTKLGDKGYMLNQFTNPANPAAHRTTTGPEIWRDTDGTLDIFVGGVGTGGTVMGVTQYIKGAPEVGCPSLKPDLYTVVMEPQEQMLMYEAKGGNKDAPQGPHKIQGVGVGVLPVVLNLDYVDEVVPVHSDQAMEMMRQLWLMGLPTGVSAGGIVHAAVEVLKRPESRGKTAVCIIPSFGERYFTHPALAPVRDEALNLKRTPLPEPWDNRQFGFATERG